MFYNNQQFNFNLVKFYKPYINNKFIFIRFFFLTNCFFYIDNLLFNTFNKNELVSNVFLTSKKNLKFYYKMYNQFRKFLFFKKYALSATFKFSFFFKTLYKINNLKNKNYNFSVKIRYENLFLKNYKLLFYKNWYFLKGSSISPYSWDLYSKKKWIRKNLNFILLKNLFYLNKKNKNKLKTVNNLFFKKILLNNFFYLKKTNINFNKMNFMLKIKNTTNSFKNNYNWFLSRPYLFLNNYENYKISNFYSNYFLINLYKNYSKFFYNLKKFNFSLKMKNINDVSFKKFLISNNLANKFVSTNVYTNFLPLSNYFSFFYFKTSFDNFINTNLLKKKNKAYRYNKLISKFFFINKFTPKTKIFKKNKINSLIFFNKKGNIFKKSILNNFKFFKLSKRIKKLNFIYLFNNLKKNFWINNFNPALMWNKFYFNNKNTYNIIFFNNYSFIVNSNFKKLKSLITVTSVNFNLLKKNKTSFILNNLKKPVFFSREKNFFILNKYSFLFLNDFLNNYQKNFKFVYNLKKTMYSFSYKNEVQKFILKRYNKINFTNNYYNNYLTNISTTLNINHSFKVENFFTNDFDTLSNFFKKKSEIFFLINHNFFNSNNWTYFNENINFSKNSLLEDNNFNIKRVRFKPGYMSLWREVRSVFKTSLNLKFKYQYKLTNYLSKYNKFIKFKTFLLSEMRLFNILLRTRLLNDHNLCFLFIKNNLIYVNGHLCSNHNFQLFVGDFLQLIINLKYYILYKWFLNLSIKKKNKLRNVSKKKMHFSVDSDEKKRSNSLPKWILFSKNSFDDVAKYTEVDYFTLSAIILYEPFNWSDINTYNLIDQRFGIINLYNWKYIT